MSDQEKDAYAGYQEGETLLLRRTELLREVLLEDDPEKLASLKRELEEVRNRLDALLESAASNLARDAEFEAMVRANVWHEDLQSLLDVVRFCTQPGFVWSWVRTPRCKYVDVRIDMRDGGFVIKDQDGKRISLEQLKRWGQKTE